MDKEPITLNGLNKLKEELVFLKEKKIGRAHVRTPVTA